MKAKKARFTHQPCGLESLERRSLMSAYVYNSADDFLNLANPIHNVPMPQGIEISGFGASLAALGDIDADGYDDFAVSARLGAIGTGGSGVVYLFSGQDASLIRMISDGAWDFGASMVSLGDMNNDGVADLLVGSPRHGADPVDNTGDPFGRVYIYSGMDGTILRTLEGATPSGDFGRVVARLANGDGDNIPDLVIGAPGSTLDLAGEAFIFAGSDGSLLRTFTGAGAGDRFGAAIATGTGGGISDGDLLAIGAPFHDEAAQNTGRVYVFHTDGTLAYVLDGFNEGDEFGTSLAIARMPGASDASSRLLVGTPGADTGGFIFQTVMNRGSVSSYDLGTGGDARVVWAIDPTANARFGSQITVLRNSGGLGAEQVLIGASGTGRSYATTKLTVAEVIDFADLSPLALSVHGNAFASVGDINNDGIIDIISSDAGGAVTIVSSLALQQLVITGASSDLRYMWAEGGAVPVLFIDGVARAYSHVPGLSQASPSDPSTPTSRILAIGNDGVIVFINQYADETPDSELMVNVAGEVATLASLVQTLEGQGPVDYHNLHVAKVGSDGHILLSQGSPLTPSDTPALTWIYSNGVLTHLWNG
ncbi:MAG: FG-GAP repeat protein, partial [Pyrinomonadaceae bacterium]|nr:FG-GAP repeat protein [Phycisphaerales bacterium]